MAPMRTGEHVPPRAELRRDFGIEAESFERDPMGFESESWIADGGTGPVSVPASTTSGW